MKRVGIVLAIVLAFVLVSYAADTGWKGIFGTDDSPSYTTTFTGTSTSRTLKFVPSRNYNGDASLVVYAVLNSGSMPTVTVSYRKYYGVDDDNLQYGPWNTLGTFSSASTSTEFVVSKDSNWGYCDGVQFKFTASGTFNITLHAAFRIR